MMNFRVVLLVFIIFIFAAGFGVVSYSESLGIPLKEAYDDGKVTVTQNTTAGTVPHLITVQNNGTKPVKVQEGDILKSTSSQDVVIAEDNSVPQKAVKNVNAYCFEPTQKAVPGAKLEPSATASSQIKKIINSSNPADVQNATDAQLQIWIIVSGGNLNIYSGEPVALVDTQGITFSKLRQEVADARSSVMANFHVTSGGLQTLAENTTNSGTILDNIEEWLNLDWLSGS